MNCQTIRNLLSAYIDCELSPEQRNSVRHHLFQCEACEHEHRQLLNVKEHLESNLNAVPNQFDSWKALQERISAEEATPISRSGDLFWVKKLTAMAACLLIFFIMASLLFPIYKRDNSSLAYIENERKSSADQKISIEKSFEVYQASLIIP